MQPDNGLPGIELPPGKFNPLLANFQRPIHAAFDQTVAGIIVDKSVNRLPFFQQSERNGTKGKAQSIVVGAINGIEHPTVFALQRQHFIERVGLLRTKIVAGKRAAQFGKDAFGYSEVGESDTCVIFLPFTGHLPELLPKESNLIKDRHATRVHPVSNCGIHLKIKLTPKLAGSAHTDGSGFTFVRFRRFLKRGG